MCDQNDRDPLLLQFLHQPQHIPSGYWIKHAGRLIEHDTARLHCKYPSDRHLLLSTAGQFLDPHGCRKAYLCKRILHPLHQFLVWHADILRTESNILFHNTSDQLIVGILEHHANHLPDRDDISLLHRIKSADQNRTFNR